MPQGPCYAVIFASQRAHEASNYSDVAARMVELAQQSQGYLGHVSARGTDGFGITVSYWASLADIARFRAHEEHVLVQTAGRERYYTECDPRVARVERQTRFPTNP